MRAALMSILPLRLAGALLALAACSATKAMPDSAVPAESDTSVVETRDGAGPDTMPATGGVTVATGGVTVATGGVTVATGGVTVATGGMTGQPDAGAPGGAGGVVPSLRCATGLFRRSLAATAHSAYTLTLTPTAAGFTGELQRQDGWGTDTLGATSLQTSMALSGVVGADRLALAFPGGDLQVTALPGALPWVFLGGARFDDPLFDDDGPVDSLALACWPATYAARFRYDPGTGQCRDAQGQAGRQAVAIPMLRDTRNGECATLSAAGAPARASALSLNDIDLGYPKLVGWNLAGADLAGGSIYFALLLDADMRGADFTGFEAGYQAMTGPVDAYTTGLTGVSCPASMIHDGLLRCCLVGGCPP